MTYTVIDCSTNFVTRGVNVFIVNNLSEEKSAIIKDSTLIDKGLKYPNEFITEFATVFKKVESNEINHVILTSEANEALLRIMLFNREDK